MILFIDDTRTHSPYKGEPDIIARSFEAGIKILDALDIPLLILDHDLGEDDSIDNLYTDGVKIHPVYRNGYGILQFLEQKPKSKRPAIIVLATSNPVGRNRMEQILHNMGYIVSGDNSTFIRE